MQIKPAVIFFSICRYSVTYGEFKILELNNFVKTDRNATKICARLFAHKTIKNKARVKL